MTLTDVPSPIDFRQMSDAQEWERTAMQRPFREDFFEAFANELDKINKPSIKVLELGSGPGFLAQHILSRLAKVELSLLDFSPAMHELAGRRLTNVIDRVTFVERSFKEPGWEQGLGKLDAVITNQAVHELRHKRYSVALFQQVKSLLIPGGLFLFCDHYYGDDAMKNDQLYMSLTEQRAALQSAGYSATEILVKGGRAFYRAQPDHQIITQ